MLFRSAVRFDATTTPRSMSEHDTAFTRISERSVFGEVAGEQPAGSAIAAVYRGVFERGEAPGQAFAACRAGNEHRLLSVRRIPGWAAHAPPLTTSVWPVTQLAAGEAR